MRPPELTMRRALFTCAVAAATSLLPAAAFADEKAACLDAVAKGQTLRDEHKLIAAREQFRICARSQCPGVVQGDCASFLDAVERNLPSVVFTAKDGAGADLADVKVSADGQPLVTRLDGAAVAIDPGPHTFVFTSTGGGGTSKVSATVLEGAKNQIVSVTIGVPPGAPAAAKSASGGAGAAREPAAAALKPNRGERASEGSSTGSKSGSWLPVAAIAVGGVGLVSGAVFTVLAHGKRTDGDNLCTGGVCPDATASQVASLNSDATAFGQVATASYVVGGVALAAGVVLLLVNGDGHKAPPTTTTSEGVHVQVGPTVGFGTVGIAGVF